ncbi:hypothetical protein J2S03_002997 [Alicyclobacillus cycloheptanicus]|uniref:Uncharacterized protein n=1 Tax=Alicyclobacillus cycloheptanicus TaxID=1457 RepID=A0ABT9XLD7_9BACL|nr:hypothetical protein [Alicyclobacillus cycloheptanicus]
MHFWVYPSPFGQGFEFLTPILLSILAFVA